MVDSCKNQVGSVFTLYIWDLGLICFSILGVVKLYMFSWQWLCSDLVLMFKCVFGYWNWVVNDLRWEVSCLVAWFSIDLANLFHLLAELLCMIPSDWEWIECGGECLLIDFT